MELLSLELENVKSYDHAEIHFTRGVNAIVGHNGAGKSTILEAIGYTLFDALTYTTANFVREGARTGRAAVTFLSDYDERPYRVERKFGSSSSYAVFDGELNLKICDGKADVLAFIRRHTNADPTLDLTRLFNDALGVAQGSLTAAFHEYPSKRKPIFDSLLQVDEYDRAHERLRDPVRALETRIQDLDKDIAVLATRLEQLPELERAVKARRTELDQTTARLATITTRLGEIHTRIEAMEALQAHIDTLTRTQMRSEETLRGLARQAQHATAAVEEAENAAKLVKEHETGYAAYLAARERQSQLETQRRTRQALLETKAAADKELALCQSEQRSLEQQLQEIVAASETISELAPAVARQQDLEETLAAAERDAVRQQELKRQLETERRRAEQLRQRHAALVKERSRVTEIENAGKSARERIEELRRELERIQHARALCQAETTTLERRVEVLSDGETAVCPVCAQPLGDTHRRTLLAESRARLKTLAATMETHRTQSLQAEANIKVQEQERTRLQNEWRKLPRQEELDDLQAQIEAAERAQAEAAAEHERLAASTAQIATLRAELAALGDPKQLTRTAEQIVARRAVLERNAAEAARRRMEAQRKLSETEAALAQYAELDAALDEVAKDLQSYQEAYQIVLTHRQVADSLDRRRADLADLLNQQENESAAAAELARQLEELHGQFDREGYQQLVLDDRKLREEQGGLQARTAFLSEAQTRDEATIETLRVAQTTHEELQASLSRTKEHKDTLEVIRGVLKRAGPRVTLTLIRHISDTAAQIYGDLMQDHSRMLRWNEDYGITLDVSGNIRDFKLLSGGEQMSAALAVRLALVREMGNVDIAFFDEPTANLDSARREALAQQIMNIRGFRQLFVISHDDTFEQATQNLIRVARYGSTTVVDSAGQSY
ncbi:MAG: SMC family ATPase [Caldilineaceae bacterium]|nr:SMC family ATPase [Caldilineaceae bacterium]